MKMKQEINDLLESFIQDKRGFPGKIWAISTTGIGIDYYSSQICALLPYAHTEIRDALMDDDKKLYQKCIFVRKKGYDMLAQDYNNLLLGGRNKITSTMIDEEGNTSTSIKTVELNQLIIKRLISPEKDTEGSFLSNLDRDSSERYFSISEELFVVPERLVLKEVKKLQSYQFEYFKILDDYLNVTDREIECKTESLFLNLVGGYQSGKTVCANLMFMFLLNSISNSKSDLDLEEGGDILLIGATHSALRRNVINRVCAIFKLNPPSINSTVWKLSNNIKISLLTSGLISYNSLKGSSAKMVYLEEADSAHPALFSLLLTRMSSYFNVGGIKKCVFLSTSNPKNPIHHFTKFLYNENHKSVITKRVKTWHNKYLSKEYLDMMAERYGGVDSIPYRIYMGGESLYSNSPSSVFNILESNFTEDSIDNYLPEFQCSSCENLKCGSNIDCEACLAVNDSKAYKKSKNFTHVSIGFDNGFSAQRCFCATFFYIEDNCTKCLVLDELIYNPGHDAQFAKSHGFEALQRLKRLNLKELIMKCYSICRNVSIKLPHDCPEQSLWINNTIQRYGLECKVERVMNTKNLTVKRGIDLIRTLLEKQHLTISNSCRNLKEQMYLYEFDFKKSEEGLEVIKKLNDHSVDALRYSIINYTQEFNEPKSVTDFI